MDPQQPTSSNPYGFIMDANHIPKPKRLPGDGSPKMKVLFIALAITTLIVLYVIVSNVFLGKGNSGSALIKVRAQQAEIIRTASLGVKEATSTTTKNYVQTILSSVTSEQIQISNIMNDAGIKISKTDLSSRSDKTLETRIESAKKNNKFDTTITETLKSLLAVYQSDLSQAYNVVSTDKSKVALKSAFSSTDVILD